MRTLLDIDASGHVPRDVRYAQPGSFDVVISMDAEVATTFRDLFPTFPSERLIEWDIPDPWEAKQAEYLARAQLIAEKLERFVAGNARAD